MTIVVRLEVEDANGSNTPCVSSKRTSVSMQGLDPQRNLQDILSELLPMQLHLAVGFEGVAEHRLISPNCQTNRCQRRQLVSSPL